MDVITRKGGDRNRVPMKQYQNYLRCFIRICIFMVFSIKHTYCQKLNEWGLVKINDSFYVDKYEVTNGDYRYFLKSVNRYKKTDTLFPDTIVWRRVSIEPYVKLYFIGSYFSFFPVVGIDRARANAYCMFKAEQINNSKNGKNKNEYVYSCRLPTKDEWNFLATYSNNATEVYLKRQLKNKNKSYLNKVYTGKPNYFGIYNLYGNVSELLLDSKSIGLSFLDTILIDSIRLKPNLQNYVTKSVYDSIIEDRSWEYYPSDEGRLIDTAKKLYLVTTWSDIGFRCVCKKKKRVKK